MPGLLVEGLIYGLASGYRDGEELLVVGLVAEALKLGCAHARVTKWRV